VSWQRGRPPAAELEQIERHEDILALAGDISDEIVSDLRDDEQETAFLHILTEEGCTRAVKVLAFRDEQMRLSYRRQRHARELRDASLIASTTRSCLTALGYDHLWPAVEESINAALRAAQKRVAKKKSAPVAVSAAAEALA
jgi:hypothetical protein